MSFNSLEFLIFLPIVVILYWIIPYKFRWILLLIASYYFYMSWNAWFVFLIAGTTLVSYLAAIFMERTQKKSWRRFWFAITIIVCLGALVFFKYFNFLIENVINFLNLFSMHLEGFAFDIILPVGISFYTFQTLSYVIDVYRGNYKAEKHLGYYALFVSFFPQLVAGPIERPDHLIPQLRERHYLNSDDFSAGLRMLLTGFFRKCVIADMCAIYVDSVFSQLDSATSLAIFCGGALFLLQMYNDFAGYSEIAAGAARMMGIKLMRNFDRPFLATSVSEFFRRWHISLTQWFTDYVYIPLGGNRKGVARRILNTIIVFFLCGLWHGASWTYVIWGILCGLYMGIESIVKGPWRKFKKKVGWHLNEDFSKLISRVLLFVLYVPGSIIFRCPTVSDIGTAFTGLFTRAGISLSYFAETLDNLSMDSMQIAFLAVAIVVMALMYNFSDDFGDHRDYAKKAHVSSPMQPAAAAASTGAVLQAKVEGVKNSFSESAEASVQAQAFNESIAQTQAVAADAEMKTTISTGLDGSKFKGMAAQNSLYMEHVSVYLYLTMVIAFCWLFLLSGTGSSAFAYFQF
ncbi:MAG: MBOAT family protein [Clostridia bacterium]|nr:MBOAT family protein [Clostridia bacterium]